MSEDSKRVYHYTRPATSQPGAMRAIRVSAQTASPAPVDGAARADRVRPAAPSGTETPGNVINLGVLGLYGATMVQVQAFEFELAVLVGLVEAQPGNKSPERPLKKVVAKSVDLFQKASAKRVRRRLEGQVDEELIDFIEPLIEWRNFLAHRYLRVRLARGTTRLIATPEMASELRTLAGTFAAACKRLTREQQAIMSRWPEQFAPDRISVAVSDLAAGVVTFEPGALPSTEP